MTTQGTPGKVGYKSVVKAEPMTLASDEAGEVRPATDRDLAAAVRKACDTMNAAIDHAVGAGLNVEIRVIDATHMGSRGPTPMVTPIISVPL